MSNPCLITGCRLVIAVEGKKHTSWGDLHKVGDETLVFNAVLQDGETFWEYGKPREGVKEVSIIGDNPRYFERRGVIVFERADASFNDLAAEHLRRWGA